MDVPVRWAMRQSCGIAPKRSVRFWRKLTPTPGNTLTAFHSESWEAEELQMEAKSTNSELKSNKIMLYVCYSLLF